MTALLRNYVNGALTGASRTIRPSSKPLAADFPPVGGPPREGIIWRDLPDILYAPHYARGRPKSLMGRNGAPGSHHRLGAFELRSLLCASDQECEREHILAETVEQYIAAMLEKAGLKRVYGIVGGPLNGFTEACVHEVRSSGCVSVTRKGRTLRPAPKPS
jgi:hypothetical protein